MFDFEMIEETTAQTSIVSFIINTYVNVVYLLDDDKTQKKLKKI